MALDWISTPVSDEAPCGPDLDSTDDPDFVDYYFDALGRLPERYFTPGVNRGDSRSPDIVFDPKSVDIKRELGHIDPLLQRSRDVRLLTLRAQWQILSGRLEAMAETVEALAAAIETFGSAIHPVLDGSVSARREALQELSQQNTVLLPLMYQPLDTTGTATLRRLRVALGDFTPGDGEEGIDAPGITTALASPGDRAKVDASHSALVTIRTSIDRIVVACKASEAGAFSPGLEPLAETIDRMLGMVGDARPDLRETADAAAGDDEEEIGDGEEGTGEGGEAGEGIPAKAGPVNSQAAARQALLATEGYLRANEPSSAALLLITQARQLIGKSLMEALDVLMPEHAGRAAVSFGPQSGFGLTTDRLRTLASEAGEAAATEDGGDLPDPPEIADANGAAAVLRTVEDFYRKHERSSPVPVILQRARSYLSKDFQSLIDELIPAQEE